MKQLLKGLTPEEFINKHPFPENGPEINDALVKEIQRLVAIKNKLKSKGQSVPNYLEEEILINVQDLFRNNARLIFVIYKQYNYNQEMGSTMSFVYQGLDKAARNFDLTLGTPFYSYAIQVIRGMLQNYYHYHEKTVHVPVNKKDDDEFKYEFADINDHLEHEHMNYVETEENPLIEELNMIMVEYENQKDISEVAREDFNVLKLSRELTLKEIGKKLSITPGKAKKMKDRSIERIKRFHRKLQKELGS